MLLLGSAVCLPGSPSAIRVAGQTAPTPTLQPLLDKAKGFEARGRMDLAAQTWQQVLLADPKNRQALGGLARAAKLAGDDAKAVVYLDRLSAIDPNDPGIALAGKVKPQPDREALLREAAREAKAGRFEQAMDAYRQVYGDEPPAGDAALAYYETEAATANGRGHGIAGLRGLATKFPGDSRYAVALGRNLTYVPATRAEGKRILRKYPNDAEATEALRQALVWDSGNPATAAEIRAYVAENPDAQMSGVLAEHPRAVAVRRPGNGAGSGTGPTGAERAGYAALNARRLEDAERQFEAALRQRPTDSGALAGMGYLRMQQANFGGALSFLLQARQNGSKDKGLDAAIATSRFWLTMSYGAEAFRRDDLREAERQYRLALVMRPGSVEAREGLGGTLLKAEQPRAAELVFQTLLRDAPDAPPAWRGVFLAQCGEENKALAIETERRMPDTVRGELVQDPVYLRALAAAYVAVGREPDAAHVLQVALDLPFPADASDLEIGTKLEYAALLEQANRLEQARGLYRQVVAREGNNLDGWKGYVRVQHALDGTDGHEAIAVLGRVPGPVFGRAMRDPGFEQTVASIYADEGEFDKAQDLLIQVMSQQASGGRTASLSARMQLAGLYVQRKNPAQAYVLYRQVLTEAPGRLDAMKGFLATLHAAGRNQQAIEEIQEMDPAMRTQLERDVEYLRTVAAVYTDGGQPHQAEVYLARAKEIYAIEQMSPPAEVEIENAWLLYNTMDDAGLYEQLMSLGGRGGLSDAQRRTVQTIWIDWAVRRANRAVAEGHRDRAKAILEATATTFPGVPGVNRALANGYARAGDTQRALELWKAEDLSGAAPGDVRAAVGAAVAEGDDRDAERWLRGGLEQNPRDPQMLMLAARMDESKGDVRGAVAHYRASLDAMPPEGAGPAMDVGRESAVNRLPGGGGAPDLPQLLRPDAGSSRGVGQLPGYKAGGQETSPAVPAYMANPRSAPAVRVPTSRPSLRDYVPQASMKDRVPDRELGIPAAAGESSGGRETALTPAVYQQRNVAGMTYRLVGWGQVAGVPAGTPAVPAVGAGKTVEGSGVGLGLRPGPLTVQPVGGKTKEEVYGPYVPYQPGLQAETGAGSAGHKVLLRREVPARDDAFAGRSAPPQDEPGMESVQYATPASAPGQVRQPAVAQSTVVLGQQYPEPGTGAETGVSAGLGAGAGRARSSNARTIGPRAGASGKSAPRGRSTKPTETSGVRVPSFTGAGTPVASELDRLGALPLNAEASATSVSGGGSSLPLPLSDRRQAQLELASLEGSYSSWLGATGYGRYRSGNAGVDRLSDIETSVEASAMFGERFRVTVVPTSVFLQSGLVNPAAFAGTGTVLGTSLLESSVAPGRQSYAGVGGEIQVATRRVEAALGYTPYDFLVGNVIGRVSIRATRHLTFYGDRSAVNETELSYAGLRDPGTATPTSLGNIWGGVVSTGGGVRVDGGTGRAGFYVAGGGAALTGYHVLRNNRVNGLLGAYFLVHRWTDYGRLTVGASLSGEHYANDEIGLSYGQGGYFSPDAYFLATIPVTWEGHYRSNFHYRVTGSLGLQTYEESSGLFYPLDPALQMIYGSAALAASCPLGGAANLTAACHRFAGNSMTGANYGVDGEAAYLAARHWYFGGFLTANNTNNYNTVAGGFFVRYVFRPQFPVGEYPTGLFPATGTRQLRIP